MSNKLKCQECGKEKPDVEEVICPFNNEINETEIWIVVCENCFENIQMEI